MPGYSSKPGTIDITHRFFNVENEDNVKNALKIPSLRGIQFLAPYGHDGKFFSLSEFTRHVIVNMFSGEEPDAFILDSLVAYQRELDFLPNGHLDRQNRLLPSASQNTREGQKLFEQHCSGCHIRTSYFVDNRVHRLGSKKDIFQWSFEGAVKTPTLLGRRGSHFFHQAKFNEIGDVTSWFNQQMQMNLGPNQQANINSYLEVLAFEERPHDERHISERLVETISLLKLFDARLFRKKYQELVLETVILLLKEKASLLKTRSSRMGLEVTIKELSTWLKKGLQNEEDYKGFKALVKNRQSEFFKYE